MKAKITLVSFLLSVFCVASANAQAPVPVYPSATDATEHTEPLLGGVHIDFSQTAIAAVLGPKGQCTGTLVGPREVLTAAHCVLELGAIQDLIVVLGNAYYKVDMGWYHGAYGFVATASNKAHGGRAIGLPRHAGTVGNVHVEN